MPTRALFFPLHQTGLQTGRHDGLGPYMVACHSYSPQRSLGLCHSLALMPLLAFSMAASNWLLHTWGPFRALLLWNPISCGLKHYSTLPRVSIILPPCPAPSHPPPRGNVPFQCRVGCRKQTVTKDSFSSSWQQAFLLPATLWALVLAVWTWQ